MNLQQPPVSQNCDVLRTLLRAEVHDNEVAGARLRERNCVRVIREWGEELRVWTMIVRGEFEVCGNRAEIETDPRRQPNAVETARRHALMLVADSQIEPRAFDHVAARHNAPPALTISASPMR